MKKVNKTQAKKAYESGKTIHLNPCKFAFPNGWHTWSTIRKTDEVHEYLSTADFDSRLANFEFYNCSYEAGYYTHFYVED